MGRPARESTEILLKLTGLPLSVDEYLKERAEIIAPLFAEAEFLPGAERLLLQLSDLGIPMCLATSSSRELVEIKTAKTRAVFDRVFGEKRICGDELEGGGKPDPEIFVRALKMISEGPVHPGNVMVFEDAPTGVAAGLAAKNHVCMIPDRNLAAEKRGLATIELPTLEWFNIEQFM